MFSVAPHKSTPIPLPVFCITFDQRTQNGITRLYVGGGGGPNRSGVKNAVVIYDVDSSNLSLSYAGEIKFSNEDDACMSVELAHQNEQKYIAVGVNAAQELIQAGDNKNLRLYKCDETIEIDNPKRYKMVKSVQNVKGKKAEHYQRVVRCNSNGSLLITGTTDGQVHLWKFPSLEEHQSTILTKDEVFDVDFDWKSELLVMVTPLKCQVILIEDGTVVFEISEPTFNKRACEFRACRFGKQSTKDYLYLTINEKSRKGSFLGQWRISDWKMIRKRQIAKKPVTAFTLSPDGERIAVGVADLSVVVLSAHSLNAQSRVQDAHSFPVTCVAFSPDSKLVASGSADSSIHLISLPKTSSLPSITAISLLMVLLLIIVMMFLIHEIQEL